MEGDVPRVRLGGLRCIQTFTWRMLVERPKRLAEVGAKTDTFVCLKSIILHFISIKWLRFCYSIRNTCINILQVLAGRQ